MAEHVDFMETPLPTILLALREQLEAAEAQVRRYDQGITAFLWELDKLPAAHAGVITPKMAQHMLDALGIYGETGRKADAIERALEELA